jgi:hypothetical protein
MRRFIIIMFSIVAVTICAPAPGVPEVGRAVVSEARVTYAHTQVPAELVGRWNGGSNESGHWYFEFHENGYYRAWPAYVDNPSIIEGEYSVSGQTITLSNYDHPIEVRWSISAGILYLNGYSYVSA